MAMPWTRAKQIARALQARRRGDDSVPFPDGYSRSRSIVELTELFRTCFRLQREASLSAGRHIPLVVENVRGAQSWVGPARAHYGSFYLWGDVPAAMPAIRARKNSGGSWFNIAHNTESGKGRNPDGRLDGTKVPSTGGRRTDVGKGARFTSRDCGDEAVKNGGDWFSSGEGMSLQRRQSSKSSARKAASARIAMIPYGLSTHIARAFKPVADA